MQNAITGPLSSPSADMINRTLDGIQSRARMADAASDQQKKNELKKVAHDFESLFVNYLLKVMRETIDESNSPEGGLGKSIYTELFDEELSRSIARQGTFGIADMLVNRLSIQDSVSQKAPAKVQPVTPEVERQRPAAPVAPVAPAQSIRPDPELEISDVHLPVRAPISSGFGIRRDPFTRQLRFHKGMDLAAPEGIEVQAAQAGEVVFSGVKRGYGNTVIIRHAGGLETTYAHLGDLNVKRGDTVSSGQRLGSVGNTGHSTGPHLHFEVSRWGESIDPREALAD